MNAIMHPRAPAPVLTPTTFDQLLEFARIAADSELVPKDFRNKPGNIMIACQMGSELGLSPMQSLNSIAVINGRAGVWGDGLIGLCRQSPLCEDITETFEGEGDARVAICIAKRRGAAPVEGRFSVTDAKRAQLWGKAIWAAYPDRMLKNRARSFALRDAFPDVLRGLRGAEELMDTPPDDFRGSTIEAKPATIPSAAPVSGLIQGRTDHRAAQQEAATTPPPKKMTVAEFLDALDRELDLAPEAALVEAVMTSKRVTDARAFLRNGAAHRLSDWTVRAEAKRQMLLAAEQAAQSAEPETMPETIIETITGPAGDTLDGVMPWPMIDEPAEG